MTAKQFRAIRFDLGLSELEWGLVLGYGGKPGTVRRHIRKIEAGTREITPWLERLAEMYRRHGIPQEWMPS